MEKIKQISVKWYRQLGFDAEYDEAFFKAIEKKINLAKCNVESYLKEENEDKEKNFIMFLYFCEALSKRYEEKGIPEEIFFSSLADLKTAVSLTKKNEGIIGIERDAWVTHALKFELFRIGRLQFQMRKIYDEAVAYGYDKNESVIDVHIPSRGGSLTFGVCEQAFEDAEDFFKNYFPEYEYKYCTCFSWMLDDTLSQFLDENSNIRKFRKRFTVIHKREQDSILYFMFKMGIKSREELLCLEPKSAFAQKVKDYSLQGGKLYNVLGCFER